jgi:hypothetical protein
MPDRAREHVRLRVDAGLGCALSIGMHLEEGGSCVTQPGYDLVQLNLVCDRPGPAMVVVPSLLRMIDIPTKEAEQCSPRWPSILMT